MKFQELHELVGLISLTEAGIDKLYANMGGIQPSSQVPVFTASGHQILNKDGTLKTLSYNHVAAVNQWFAETHEIKIDPESTLSSHLSGRALFLGAVDVCGVTYSDTQMVLGIRSAFQNAASVAPRKVFDLASGFRSLIKETSKASPASETAKSELYEEVGLTAYWGQFQSVHGAVNSDRLIHFPSVPTNSGETFKGLCPTFSNSYVVWLPFRTSEISRVITLSNEYDGVLTAPAKDVLALWAGETDKISAVIYPSARLNGINYFGETIGEIFANARLNPAIQDKERVTLRPPIDGVLTQSDSMINGSMASVETKAKLLRAFGL